MVLLSSAWFGLNRLSDFNYLYIKLNITNLQRHEEACCPNRGRN
jgi:hypothetical protein